MRQPQPAQSTSHHAVFQKYVPEAFIDAWLNTIAAVNRRLARECSDRYSAESARDVLPQMRRGEVEDKFFELVGRFGGVATRAYNKTNSSCHVEGVFGDGRVLVVENYARDESVGPRLTGYVQEHAAELRQMYLGLSMFSKEIEATKALSVAPSPEMSIFAQLVYGPTARSARGTGIPGFARVLFPSAEKGFSRARPLVLNNRLIALLNKTRSAQETIHDDLLLAPRALPKLGEADGTQGD
ncbi:hypothetical protein [Corallococcus sp. AS-1-6]|uniref:hypothetical protein n=1 Tax=Corallococcus sp. AS-1-6 TaxID=2874599 RepID=UPI001CBEFB77|nr:hypothetical protein [Corallococcus sp. AS-1-6]MBZ4373277.1 hypothetical protein [Corallococcus sp. AS-1-6]